MMKKNSFRTNLPKYPPQETPNEIDNALISDIQKVNFATSNSNTLLKNI